MKELEGDKEGGGWKMTEGSEGRKGRKRKQEVRQH